MKPSDSLQDFAYEEIKKRIQNGEYAPGTKLNTQEISDSLGISRSPVLAAINRLIALGLVEATPRKGTTVAQLCIRNIEYHPSIIKEMETVVQEFETALEAGYPAAAELETKFHTLYISLCGNPQIMKLYESNWSIGTMFYMYSATNLPLDQLKTSFHQHKEILNTLKAKDEAALQKIIEEHMSIVYETLEWYSQAAKH